jgi:uncharacterized RDD family membrane protein YckC
MSTRAVDYAYAGSRYLLGYAPGFFGIWVRGTGGIPLRQYPRTDDGWAAAWTEFRALEPFAVRLTRGRPRPEAEPERPRPEQLDEGETSAVLASPSRRFVAGVLDLSILAALVLAILAVTGRYPTDRSVDATTRLLSGMWWVLIVWCLYNVPLTAVRGQTVGKMALRIRVAALPEGGDPGFGRAFVRWLVPVAMNIVPGLGLLAYAVIFVDPMRQGLHDKAASTVVVLLDGVRVGPTPQP